MYYHDIDDGPPDDIDRWWDYDPTRFWIKIDRVRPNTNCWPWLASKSRTGYGLVRTCNIETGRGTWRRAHRIAYELVQEVRLDTSLEVDHLCHNLDPDCHLGSSCPHRLCCNPDHLEAVTPAENQARAGKRIRREIALTQCPKGHPYTVENIRIGHRGEVKCRQCHREFSRNRYALDTKGRVRQRPWLWKEGPSRES